MEGEILWIFLEAYLYTARKFFAYSEGVYPSLKTTALENCFCDKEILKGLFPHYL